MSGLFQPEGSAAEAEIERRLREQYRAEDAPAALTERILAQARRQQPGAARGGWLRRHAPLASLASVLLTVCVYVALGVVHQRQIQARRAQQAQAHLLYALQITAGELSWAEAASQRNTAAGRKGTGRP